ncbi:MAG: hypothetical protein EBU84_19710, partial [Actinobacteria bacterium]|nr:hypothetical protein [Actinomycetota bacterium]
AGQLKGRGGLNLGIVLNLVKRQIGLCGHDVGPAQVEFEQRSREIWLENLVRRVAAAGFAVRQVRGTHAPHVQIGFMGRVGEEREPDVSRQVQLVKSAVHAAVESRLRRIKRAGLRGLRFGLAFRWIRFDKTRADNEKNLQKLMHADFSTVC